MRNADTDTLDDLLDVARTFNDDCEPPMEDTEVMSVVRSAWGITSRGDNRFGTHDHHFIDINRMICDQDTFLLAFLRANQGPDATFMCANRLAEKFNWTIKRLANARRRLIEMEYIRQVSPAWTGHAALSQWTGRKGRQVDQLF